MTPQELYDLCLKSGDRVTLVRPRGLINGFPRGELLQENHNGTTVRSYETKRVIKWLIDNELVAAQEQKV